MVHTIAHACMHANTLLNTRSDQTLQLLSAVLDKIWMSHTGMGFYKASSVCLIIQQGKRENTKEHCQSQRGELTLPREHHYLFMRCQTQRVKTRIGRCAATRTFLPLFLSKCLNLQCVPVIHVPSDLLLFLWSGSLAD